MSVSITAMFRGIWSFFMGSLRMIFFFGCLLLMLIHLASLAIVFSWGDRTGEFPMGYNPTFFDMIRVLGFLFTAGLGCYGAFYKHHPSIKAFAIISGVVAGLTLVGTMFASDAFEEINDKFYKDMKALMPRYDWSLPLDAPDQPEANQKWNKIQKIMCCGLNGPQDWDQYSKHHQYPGSCCPRPTSLPFSGTYCNGDTAYDTGCMKRLQQMEFVGFAFVFTYSAFQLVLCLMACLLVQCQPSNSEGQQSSSRSAPSVPSTTTVHHYQPMHNDTYIRQPPVNMGYQSNEDKAKNIKYPDVYDTDRPKYSPPPGYTS